jgi:hypothetical protein
MQSLHLGETVCPDSAVARDEERSVRVLNDRQLASDRVDVLVMPRDDKSTFLRSWCATLL